MSSVGIRYRAEPLRSLAFGSISASYAAVGSALTHAGSQFRITNGTNAPLIISFDGVNDHIFIAESNASFDSNVGSNKGLGGGLFLPSNTIFYVKQVTAPSQGSVYISVFYAQ